MLWTGSGFQWRRDIRAPRVERRRGRPRRYCGNLALHECNTVVFDEADEMLYMSFAEDVKVILDGAGSANDQKMQCLLFSATTPLRTQ